jgi:hypothetical protein
MLANYPLLPVGRKMHVDDEVWRFCRKFPDIIGR